jgi:oxaloacetate decarboxylase alpha subunit
MAKRLEDMGVHSICIKDMAGLLDPYACEELVTRLKETVALPIAMQCHATTGLSTATYQKAIDAGIDMLDTAISPMSMTYGHTATETIVSILQGTERDTGLQLDKMADIARYFRDVRKKYAQFEGSLKGVDARILTAQVPGGMLTNMENQLKEQGAEDRLDEVLQEIPKVREDLGFIPLVTPTSQIVGTQAVLNVLTGERYKSITKETAGVLKGEYGATATTVNAALQARVLNGEQAITSRPADHIEPELEHLTVTLNELAEKERFSLAEQSVNDVLTYALFPQVGLKFLKNRDNPDAFEPPPNLKVSENVAPQVQFSASSCEQYAVRVNGTLYDVEVGPSGSLNTVEPVTQQSQSVAQDRGTQAQLTIDAPLSGNVVKLVASVGERVSQGQVVMIMEAMKMETEVRSDVTGVISQINVKEGDSVETGQALISIEANG